MKTAEQWMKEHGCFGLESVKLAEQIQLESFKSGMKFAAEIALLTNSYSIGQHNVLLLAHDTIMSKLVYLTTIPKEAYD